MYNGGMGNNKRVVDLWLSLWPFTHLVKRISNYPPFRQLFRPLLGKRIFDVTFIPINEELPVPENTFLPRQVLAELIKASSHRFIYNGCICRQKENCANYPQDLGCLFLGEAAARLHPSLGHRAGVEECLEHVERMSEAGLTGMIGRLWMDATALGVLRNFGRFLVICFCCDCCCVVRTDFRNASPYLKGTIKKLESVRVRVTDSCEGCGTCESNCFVAAITIKEGRAVIDPSLCKACGKCCDLCPQKAIAVEFDPEDEVVAELFARVGAAIGAPHRLTTPSDRH
jgi:ferredoxin